MPTVTAIALDSLIIGRQSGDNRPRPGNYFSAHAADSQPRPRAQDGASRGREEDNRVSRKPMTVASSQFTSPALYATPKAFRVSADSTPSDSLSPYVVDHKGRARGVSPLAAAPVDANSGHGLEDAKGREVLSKQGDQREEPPTRSNNNSAGLDGGDGDAAGRTGVEEGADDEFDDDFFDSRASLRSASLSDAESSAGGRGATFRRRDPGGVSFTSNSEYYDAGDDFLSDSPAERSSRLLEEMESQLRSMRLGLFDEIEKRTKAEESLATLRERWNRMASGLSRVGLSSFPPIPSGEEDARWEQREDPAQLVGREIVLTRLVSEAIARDVGRAEAEELATVAVEAKNREIARLRDRLNHCEAMKREMSRRNLEIAEQSRRRRQRRKAIRRIVWSSIGFTVVVGTSLLAYKYMPQSFKSSSPPSSEDMETTSSS